MKKTAVINVVGLSQRLLGPHTPFLTNWVKSGNLTVIDPVFPALTCSAQSTYLTGKLPAEHGIVGNGWYFKDECEVKLWRQSNKLVQSKSIWENARALNPAFTCANMFWWYNMYSSVNYSVTPRPQYRADGLKIPDCYSQPASLRDQLQSDLGTFPLFDFWGPKTSVKSSQWIADASLKVYEWHQPDLLLVYLPHLDYGLQKFGHNEKQIAGDLAEIDTVCKNLITQLTTQGVAVHVISEYGISEVNNPIHINRIFRKRKWVSVREENGLELLDAGNSRAFAVADHQIAHVYINDPSIKNEVRSTLESIGGIASVLDDTGKRIHGIAHERAGDLIAISEPESWFTYYYWEDDHLAPDFARMVDIHKKPGYDPVELFLDPQKKFIFPRIAWKLIKKKLGFRTTMDVIPLDASLVRGSHGQTNLSDLDKPVLISDSIASTQIAATDVHDILLRQIFPHPK